MPFTTVNPVVDVRDTGFVAKDELDKSIQALCESSFSVFGNG